MSPLLLLYEGGGEEVRGRKEVRGEGRREEGRREEGRRKG